MKIGALKEITSGEKRVALTPDSATHLQKLGHECLVEKDAGLAAGFSDATLASCVKSIPYGEVSTKLQTDNIRKPDSTYSSERRFFHPILPCTVAI